MNFYNDNDSYVAQWLGNLIAAGHLPQGIVDARSILKIDSDELRSFRQCHFFAGIGGWSYALALARWPADREVWTASCPCQPLSSAGQRKGHADERHLWPAFYRLIAERRPSVVFGEQVASKDGREWLAGVRADLEGLGYAVGAADLCAASVGAPHIRQRLFWVADAYGQRQDGLDALLRAEPGDLPEAAGSGATGGLADAQVRRGWPHAGAISSGPAAGVRGAQRQDERWPVKRYGNAIHSGAAGGLGNAASEQMGRAGQPWQDGVWLPCLDGKARRIEPGTFPLAHGVPARVGRLRGYGNAIVPQVAAEFVRAFMEIGT